LERHYIMNGAFHNVSGIDPNGGASIVFVWCRSRDHEGPLLLSSGHVVGAIRPPGIAEGQFSVTFPLPPGYSANDVVVTHDESGEQALSNITVVPCSAVASFQSKGSVTPVDRVVHAGTAK
jgi:hypothetical protein